MKKASKIITAILCGLAVVGAGAYEVHSIITKEYERQARSAEETHRGIDLNLDMIKIAIQTTDEEVYDKNLAEAKEGVAKLGSLSMLAEEQEEFVTRANEYVEILESKKELLKETHELKEKIREIRGAFTEKYGNKDEISRDKVKAAKDEILGWKIDASQFEEEKVVAIASAVNEMLENAAGKLGTLADCVDTCYKNRISVINDELADIFKAFSDKALELNSSLEKEFDFNKMDELRKWDEKGEDNEEI